MKLYLVRHGLTEWNKLNKFQGSSDIALAPEGIEQANKLAKKLKHYKIDAVYASDLDRAYMTAKHIAVPHRLEVKKIPELREIQFGKWEGLTIDEIKNIDEIDYNGWMEAPHSFEFPGEGNLANVQKRIMNGMRDIIDKHNNQNVLIVSHGGSLKILILSLLALDLSLYHKFWLGNTSLSIVDIKDGKSVLSLLNDMGHLEME